MADEPGAEHADEEEEEEGGPVKSVLEHLEDLRWVLIKSLAATGVAFVVCLLAGNQVVQLLKRPLEKAKISYPGTNQVVLLFFGTNQLGTFPLTPQQQAALQLGTNRLVAIRVEPATLGTNQVITWYRLVAIRVEPATLGTNQVITWRIDDNPDLAAQAQKLKIDLLSLGPAQGFLIAFQVAVYGGIGLASPFIFYFVASFVFPALKLREKRYVYRGLGFGISLFVFGVAFCYFVLMPIALAASQKYSQWLGLSAYQWKADDYISFVCKFMLGMGLGFEMPVVILTMVKIGVLNYRILSKGRRYMIV